MTVLVNSFEGGTNGTTITTGNSGGGSGNAFDTVTIPGGSTVTYSNTVSAHGTLSSAVATTTDTSSLYVQWDVSEGTQTTIYFRAYCYLPASSSGNWRPFAAESSNTHAASFFFAAGVLKTSYGSAFTNGPVFTTAIPTNQWIRIEGYVTGDPSVGALSVSLYISMDSIVPNEVHSVSGINTTGALTQYRFGQNAATANSGPYYLDDIGVSSTGYLGPSNIAIVYPQTGPVSAKGAGFPPRGRISSNAGSLPPLLLQNSFDGGTNGIQITAANSGGVSGSAFSNVSIGSGATLTYSNAEYAHGSLSGEFSTGVTSTTDFVFWSGVVGIQPKLWFRFYAYFTANPSGIFRILHLEANGGVNGIASVAVNTAGQILMLDGQATTRLTSSSIIPLNQWFRVEGFVTCSPNKGQLSVSLFATPDAQVPIETDTSSAAQYTYGPVNIIQFGITNAVASIGPFWLDNIGVSNTGYLGPVSYTAEPSTGMPGSVVAPRIPQNGPRGRSSGTVPKIIQLTNNAEGGTAGTTVTTGNSGGGSGASFDAITTVAGGILAFDNTQAAHGQLSYKVATGATSGDSRVIWTTSLDGGGPQPTLWFRAYFYFTANPVTNQQIVYPRNISGSTNCGSVTITSSGHIVLEDVTFTGQATFTTLLPLNQWFRLEGYFLGHPTAGAINCSLYLPKDSVTPVETRTATGINTAAPPASMAFGIATGGSNLGPFWMDDLGVSTAGYLGPAGLPSGATFTPQQYPIQAKGNGLPPRGRIASNPGGLVPVLLTNSFEGGTNGVTISGGNSGGISGSSFSAAIAGAGTLQFSTTEYAHGSLSGEFATEGTATQLYVGWTASPTSFSTFAQQSKFWFRFYAYFTANPGTQFAIFQVIGNNGANSAARIVVNTNGTLAFVSASGTDFTTNNSIPLNQWFRVEGFVFGSPNQGQTSLNLFSPDDSQIPIESHTSAATRNTLGPFASIRYGIPATNVANIGPFWLDDLGLSNTGPLGPVSFPGDASSGIPGTAIQVRIPQNGPRGRIGSNAGGPLRNPVPLINWRTGASVEGAGSGLSQTITIPSSVQAGDIVFLVANAGIGGSSEPSLSISSTGTLPVILGNQVQTYNGSISLTGALWWFTASATDAGKVITVTSTITTTWGLALGAWYSTSPIRIDVAPAPNSVLSGTSITAPAAITSAYGDWALYFEVNTTGAALTSNPGILRESILRAGISDSGSSVGASKTVIGGGTWASGGGSDNWIAFTVGITAGAAIVYPQEIPAQAKNIGLPARGRVYSNPGSPVVLLTNSFEGGTNAVTITSSNSGGSSGNAFNTVTVNGTPIAFSNVEAAHGSLSAKFVTTTATLNAIQWNLSPLISRYYFRAYFFFSANPVSSSILIAFFYASSGAAAVGYVQLNTTGTLTFGTFGNANIFTTTSAIPLNQWFRLEGFVTGSRSKGQVSLSLFNPQDAQVPIETHTSTPTQNTVAAPYRVEFGETASVANLTFWFDDIGVSSLGYLGPVSFPGQASSGMPGTSHQSRYKQPARGRIVSNAQKATIPPVLRSLTFSLGIPYTQWTAGSATTQWRVS